MTNADRWLVARYCGWELKKCDDPECGECGQWELHQGGEMYCADGWWDHEPTADEIVEHLLDFSESPSMAITMMEAMHSDGRSPWLLPSNRPEVGKWFVQVRVEDTMQQYPQPTIPAAVFAACLACAKEKFGVQP